MKCINPIGVLNTFDEDLNDFYKSGAKDSTLENMIKKYHLIPSAEKILKNYESTISELLFESKKKLDINENIKLKNFGDYVSLFFGASIGFASALYLNTGIDTDVAKALLLVYGASGSIISSALETKFKFGAKAIRNTYINSKKFKFRNLRKQYKSTAITEMDKLKLTNNKNY